MRQSNLPVSPAQFEYRLDLCHHVTPRLLKSEPVHRWFWFPHSFSPQLIDEILEAYPLSVGGRILDPFVGAGTTILRAGQLGYATVGTDLSPLSLFVSRVKLTPLEAHLLREHLGFVLDYQLVKEWPPLPERLERAFTRNELAHIIGLRRKIDGLPRPSADFFRLVLLRVQQRISRAVPNGGWFRWVDKEDQSRSVAIMFEQQANLQIADVNHESYPKARLFLDDARCLENLNGLFDMVITSPPYPNRHDYSRIFHIELLSLGIEEKDITSLRHQSIRSHVEAQRPHQDASGYVVPKKLQDVIGQLPVEVDTRIIRMLKGYFEDMYMVLKAVRSHLRVGGLCAVVVGNVRHAGVMVPVDEILVDISTQVGYTFEAAWVARLRGNSAQQMGRFGREPARESIVFLRGC